MFASGFAVPNPAILGYMALERVALQDLAKLSTDDAVVVVRSQSNP